VHSPGIEVDIAQIPDNSSLSLIESEETFNLSSQYRFPCSKDTHELKMTEKTDSTVSGILDVSGLHTQEITAAKRAIDGGSSLYCNPQPSVASSPVDYSMPYEYTTDVNDLRRAIETEEDFIAVTHDVFRIQHNIGTASSVTNRVHDYSMDMMLLQHENVRRNLIRRLEVLSLNDTSETPEEESLLQVMTPASSPGSA
jgi:hypothetical protein